MIRDVVELHEKFGLLTKNSRPALLDSANYLHRMKFLQEELDEFRKAHCEENLPEAFDALIDLIYVALGTAYLMGLAPCFEQGWLEVHRANMEKKRATADNLGPRGSTFDLIKPPGWTPPDIQGVLDSHAETMDKLYEGPA